MYTYCAWETIVEQRAQVPRQLYIILQPCSHNKVELTLALALRIVTFTLWPRAPVTRKSHRLQKQKYPFIGLSSERRHLSLQRPACSPHMHVTCGCGSAVIK